MRRPKVNKAYRMLAVAVCAACLFFASCRPEGAAVYAEFHGPASADAWDPLEELVFHPEINREARDQGRYDLLLTVRHTDGYPSRRLRLIVSEESDSTVIAPDTVELELADAAGRWLGKGSHGVYTRTCILRRGFDPAHSCGIAVRPDADAPVAGVNKIGLSLVKHTF